MPSRERPDAHSCFGAQRRSAWLAIAVLTIGGGVRLQPESPEDAGRPGARRAAPVAPAPVPPAPADPDRDADRDVAGAFRRRRARAEARPPRPRPRRVRPRRRRPARVPVRRADRRAACASTSTGWSIASTPTRSPRSPRATASRKRRPNRPRSTRSWRSPRSRSPTPKPPTEEAVKADLAATEHDVPIPQNAKVLAAVELLQGRLRDYVQESLTRGREVPADDPERLPRRRAAARSRLHPDHRERLQDQRAVEGERQGAVAVHEADRARITA